MSVLLFSTVGCTEAQRQAIAQQQAQQQAAQSAMNSIIVTPGDLSSQHYDILGPVEWPGSGNISLLGSACDPDHLKKMSVEQWGSRVDAIIGYHQWRDGSQIRCGGTAVHFSSAASSAPTNTQGSGPPPDQRSDCIYSKDGVLITCRNLLYDR